MSDVEPRDRPVVAQLGGSKAEDLVQAAIHAAPHCDAVYVRVGISCNIQSAAPCTESFVHP